MNSDPGNTEQPSPTTGQLVAIAGFFYLLMSALGVWLLSLQDLAPGLVIWGDGTTVMGDTAIGAGAGIAIVLLTWLAKDWGPLRDLGSEMGRELGTPGSAAIAFLAVTSAVGEELLFRGAIQQWAGVWPTVFVFGLLHGGFTKRLWLWSLFATVAGVVLGLMAELTDNLLAPILCHLTVNYFNLHLIVEDNAGPRAPHSSQGTE